MKPSPPKITRRQALGGVAAALAMPAIVPDHVMAAPGRPGANERLVTAVIGPGGMGHNHVAPDCAALCDVDDRVLARAAKQISKGKPFLTKDYRRILDREDIDAVFVAAPDHWHALMTVHACEAGKHVYCEKPACRTAAEGKAMIAAARRYRRVVQVGAQGRSNAVAHQAAVYVRNGQLGRVNRVDIWHENNWETKEMPPNVPPPAGFDWNTWLGPAKKRPFHALIHPFNFRWYMDFGGGFIRDRGAHALSVAFWLLENDGYAGPVHVEATGRPQKQGIFDVPIGLDVTWKLPARDLTITWTQPGTPKLGSSWGEVYRGSDDSLIVAGGDGGCNTEEKAKSYRPGPGAKEVYLHPFPRNDATARHRQNFLDSIRSGKRPVMDIEPAVKVIMLGNLANLSYTLKRPLSFHFGRWKFIGEGAKALNRDHLSEPYRAPWKL